MAMLRESDCGGKDIGSYTSPAGKLIISFSSGATHTHSPAEAWIEWGGGGAVSCTVVKS